MVINLNSIRWRYNLPAGLRRNNVPRNKLVSQIRYCREQIQLNDTAQRGRLEFYNTPGLKSWFTPDILLLRSV